MQMCGALISCGLRQIYGFPTGSEQPSQVLFDKLMKHYPHKGAWTMASLMATQTGSIDFLKRNGFTQFGEAKRNRRTSYGNMIVLMIRTEDDNPKAVMPDISAFYKKMRTAKSK